MAIAFAQRLMLVAFATQLLRGLLVGTDFDGTLWAALLASPIFFAVGLFCGEVARRVVDEQVDAEMRRRVEELTSGAEPPVEAAGA